MKRALISVSDKTGVVEFAQGLDELGFGLVSTGGTRRVLEDAGLTVTGIEEVTGFPEIMDGRVKTLHPAAFAGILADRANPAHMKQLADLNLLTFDVIVVNFYPFERTVTSGDAVAVHDALESIDIGGPSLLRAAAKNQPDVLPVVDPGDYDRVLEALRSERDKESLSRYLAIKVFRHTAYYDGLIADFLGRLPSLQATEDAYAYRGTPDELPEELSLTYRRAASLRYGENPHQAAALYREVLAAPGTLATARQLGGKALSFNNLFDAEAAVAIVREFDDTACVALKHTNPCGVAVADSPREAFVRARAADPVSIFGGVVAFNRPVDAETAQELIDLFLEIVIAPSFDAEAIEILHTKKNLRVLEVDPGEEPHHPLGFDVKKISGGLLVQEPDHLEEDPTAWSVAGTEEPTEEQLRDLELAWKVVKHVKSNAIVLVKDGATTGVGPGQPNRVDSVRIAIERAGENAKGSVLASDAFFPFGDSVEAAAKAGITAIVEPGGSIRDEESIAAANKAHIPLLFTGVRHFKH